MTPVKRSPGRKMRTSREQVVAAAVEIVDREGAAALTIRGLADRVGISPMGLYRYVRDRDELLDLAVEHILEELPGRATRGSWKRKAAHLFSGFRGIALRHPGVAALGVARVTPVPGMARFTARALAIMEEAGFDDDEAALAYDALLMFTIGSILWQGPRAGTERLRLIRAADLDDATVRLLERHARALGDRDPDRYFVFGFGSLLDGLASRAQRARRIDSKTPARE